jgi:hypothetical protein
MPSSFYFCYAKKRGRNKTNNVNNKAPLRQFISVFFILLIGSNPMLAACEDTLQTVISRMKPNNPTAIQYQEYRYLSLLTDKWSGGGNFYAVLPDTIIKEQQFPEKELMAIRGNSLFYFNQESGQNHQGEITDLDDQTQYIAIFKALLTGDLALIGKLYDIEFLGKPSGWVITLSAKKNQASDEGVKVIMRGLPEQPANGMELIMADGDRTEFLLSPAASGEAVKATVKTLFDLLGAN